MMRDLASTRQTRLDPYNESAQIYSDLRTSDSEVLDPRLSA